MNLSCKMEKCLVPTLVPLLLLLAWSPRGLSAPGPQVPDFCSLFPDNGPGPKCLMYLPQFFYNSTSQECEEFIYGGCGGNENRFNSKKKCLETCNPRPAVFHVHMRQHEPFDVQGCSPPRNRYNRKDNACNQSPEPGPCMGYSPQYFYNSTSRSCEIFIYGGCRGNRNRFDSFAACQMHCRDAPNLNATEVCNLAPETGPCKAAFSSLYYNPQSQRCEPFLYGGCGGNDNRFNSVKDCMGLCHPEGSDVVTPLFATVPVPQSKQAEADCLLPPETGPCRANIPMYYYNPTSQECEKFTYGGCGGNGNKFVSRRKCNLMCHHLPDEPTETPGTDGDDVCQLPPKTGPCEAHFPRYYYNKLTQKCEEFDYGGCKGNRNNFVDEEECQKTCQKD